MAKIKSKFHGADQIAKIKSEFHGADREGALKRAKKIRGRVIYSIPPGTSVDTADPASWGYWSEPSSSAGLIRDWEKIIYPHPRSIGTRRNNAY